MNDLSIIIPVAHKDLSWTELVSDLIRLPFHFEIIVVGPDMADESFNDPRVKLIFSKPGRAQQQNIGARIASKKHLWFLHSDSKLSNRNLQKIEQNLKNNPEAIFYFDLNFLPDGPRLMFLNAIGAYWRSHWFKMPFGDQGFFMAKRTFFSLGLFDETVNLGEDHLFIWKARQRNIPVLPCYSELFTSARKYQQNGWTVTTLKHISLTIKQALPEWIKYLRLKNRKKNNSAVVIFVKTPGVSKIKSRLAEDIGEEKALEFYRLSLKATEALVTEAILKSGAKLEAYWAVSEKEQLDNPLWNSFKTVAQGNGNLGERLWTVYSRLQKKHRRVFLIGSDSPQINYKYLLKANFLLQLRSEFIIGETLDGGFYLFGGRKEISRSIWNSVHYSTENTSEELMALLGKKNFIFLEKNFDIDYVEDLKLLAQHQSDELLPEQVDVIEWAKLAQWEQTSP